MGTSAVANSSGNIVGENPQEPEIFVIPDEAPAEPAQHLQLAEPESVDPDAIFYVKLL